MYPSRVRYRCVSKRPSKYTQKTTDTDHKKNQVTARYADVTTPEAPKGVEATLRTVLQQSGGSAVAVCGRLQHCGCANARLC